MRGQQTIVVIPCYNEALRLDMRAMTAFANSNENCVLLFVNDGSTDDTSEKLRFIERASARIRVLELPENCGKAEAVRIGMMSALREKPEYVGYWDADLATPLDDVLRFAECLDRHSRVQMVLGCRIRLLGRNVKRKRLRLVLGRLFAATASMVLGIRIRDTQCGAKLFRAGPLIESVFSRRFDSRWIFDVEVIARLQARVNSLSDCLYELPVQQWTEIEGSRVRPRDFLTAIRELAGIGWHQLKGRRVDVCRELYTDDGRSALPGNRKAA